MILPMLAIGKNREQFPVLELTRIVTFLPHYCPRSCIQYIYQQPPKNKSLKLSQIKVINFMFRNNVYTFKNLPIEQRQRHWTDCVCTICTAIFALTLFVLSFVMFRRQNFFQLNFPVDDTGKTCAYERQATPFIYFNNPDDISSDRYCVKKCPLLNEPIQCDSDIYSSCVALGGSKYQTQQVINRLGGFCMPTDQKLANKIWNSPQLQTKNSILHSIDLILMSLLIGLCLGLIFMIFVLCCPKLMTFLVFVTAFILLLIAGILVLAQGVQIFSPNVWNILFGVFLIISALCYLAFLGCFRKELKFAGVFMEYGCQFLKQTPVVFAYIPLFLLFTAGLLVLIIWQYVAFGSSNQPYLRDGELYKTSGHNVILQILNLIELVWGLQFLRDAFNFVISGNSIEWYFRKAHNNSQSHCCHPFSRLLCKNWGSVAGGSFLNAFFNIPDLISDLFRCNPQGSCGKCYSCYKVVCCCQYFFQLVRTDAYAYINLAGIPYCNAARQCEAMCQYSRYFQGGSQTCLRLYRLASHLTLITLGAIICFTILEGRSTYTNGYILALIVFGTYCIVTYFIDIHSDAAEGLEVCYLAEENCDADEMDICPAGLRNEILDLQQE